MYWMNELEDRKPVVLSRFAPAEPMIVRPPLRDTWRQVLMILTPGQIRNEGPLKT